MNHETNFLFWILPIVAGGMLLFATRHVYTEQQPLTRLSPPQTPAHTPFSHAIAATGILEAATQNIAVGSALSGLVIEVYVPVERVGTRSSARRSAVPRRRSPLARSSRWPRPVRQSAGAQLSKLENQPRPEEVPPSEAKVQAAKANAKRTRDEYERARALVASAPCRSKKEWPSDC